MTAGLEAKLTLAVGARVMLRRNIDTPHGLVNGAIGTVQHISSTTVAVQFDHLSKPYKVQMVKSKFMVMKNFYVYRKQFPLILAYAVTIHKCQGLSLDCAIIDLSDRVFSAGMAYVALSRVRSLAGLHLTEFDPQSIKVSVACLKEVNRLRETFRKDLPLYPIPTVSSSRKRKLTGTITQADQALAKKLVKRAIKTVVTKVTKSTRNRGKSDSPDVQIISPPVKTLKSGKSQLGKHARAQMSSGLGYSNHPPKRRASVSDNASSWLLSLFNLPSVSAKERMLDTLAPTLESAISDLNSAQIPFAPSTNIHDHYTRRARRQCYPVLLETYKLVPTNGDGSCLYNGLSLTLTGSENSSKLLRVLCAYAFMKHKHRMLQVFTNAYHYQNPVDVYSVSLNNAVDITEWGTDHHVFALSLVLNRPIFQYNTFFQQLPNSSVSCMTLQDCVTPAELEQSFSGRLPGTSKHLVYCSSQVASVLLTHGVSHLPHPPLALYHITGEHWIALQLKNASVVCHIPIPHTMILVD